MNRISKTLFEELADEVYNQINKEDKFDMQLLEKLNKLINTTKNPDIDTNKKTNDDNNISGRWIQYSLAYEYYATFEVSKNGTSYEMKVISKSEELNLIHCLRLLDVTFDGNLWSFYSDWGEKYGIANFKLYKIHANRYEGHSYLNGRRGQKTIWLRENSSSDDITTGE